MTYPVTYYCPRCETVVELPRDGYLADKSVTPHPLDGWTYVSVDEDYESDEAEGVRFVCGSDGSARDPDAEGCGRPFFLSFVRRGTTEAGSAIDVSR
ncbi:hypothetical protein DM868_00920 [Natronomonas salsuginis]|jgi:hypothetical protein|uniref:DUF7969 domain-containing protein n=1 Tax=Natronomonas salsuginis TaxID=2217661 RepID=A0A4U5JEV9_9EURY|nr:hypothetical protein [Natronomonas salsuginis]TKR27684.1 hypothetical protein DM868_00920 [Natronomonas salsuginis]